MWVHLVWLQCECFSHVQSHEGSIISWGVCSINIWRGIWCIKQVISKIINANMSIFFFFTKFETSTFFLFFIDFITSSLMRGNELVDNNVGVDFSIILLQNLSGTCIRWGLNMFLGIDGIIRITILRSFFFFDFFVFAYVDINDSRGLEMVWPTREILIIKYCDITVRVLNSAEMIIWISEADENSTSARCGWDSADRWVNVRVILEDVTQKEMPGVAIADALAGVAPPDLWRFWQGSIQRKDCV